jgi:hypothetical protein
MLPAPGTEEVLVSATRSLKRRRFAPALLALFAVAGTLFAQDKPLPQADARVPNLVRAEGSGSGIHYIRLSLSLPSAAHPDTASPPRFTVECRDHDGKNDMLWFVSFGGAEDTGYLPPFHPVPGDLFPPRYSSIKLTMSFEGYMKTKPVTRDWSLLPSGELRYRNPGIDSPNMEPPRSYLASLNSLPGLRIGYAKHENGAPAEVLFPTRPLLDELKKTPACGF